MHRLGVRDLTCTPVKHAEFLTHVFEEALSSTTLVDPWRYYQNTATSVTSKLLDKHGYADDDYKPMKSEPHKTRGKHLLLLQKERLAGELYLVLHTRGYQV